MNARALKIDRIGNGVASLRVFTDEDPYIEPSLVPALKAVIETLEVDETTRVVIVEGGARYFSAGGSKAGLLCEEPLTSFLDFVADVSRLVLSIPVPTIAAMTGHAIGGGLIFGLWCDIAVLAEESLYGANFMTLSITPGMGATAVLEEAVGAPLAREMLFTGRLMKGREIKASGGPLAYAIVPRVEVRGRAIAMAQEIAEVPRESLVLLKKALAGRRKTAFERATSEEQTMHTTLFARKETRLQILERYTTRIDQD